MRKAGKAWVTKAKGRELAGDKGRNATSITDALGGRAMEYQELKNFGEMLTPNPSRRVTAAVLLSIPKELGFVGTPTFAKQIASKQKQWKKRQFEAVQQRGLTHQKFLDGMGSAIAFYAAIVGTRGKEKATDVYSTLAEKMSVMMYEDFMPSAEDFRRCPDPWEALREYFLALFRRYEQEHVMRIEVIQNTESDLQIHISDCAWEFMSREAGYPEMAPMSGQGDVVFLPRLMKAIGGDFNRRSCLCAGDPVCDWHFTRQRLAD
jgi:hypothetical protein